MKKNAEKPNYAMVTVNRDCNNRCFGCYAIESGYEKEEMSLETAKHLLNILAELKIQEVIMLGGEPTMYSELFNVIEYATALGLKTSLTSNGRLLSEQEFAKSLIEKGLHNVTFSVKGYDRANYEEAAGADGFDEAMLGLENLKKTGLPTTISTVLFDENLEPLKKFIKEMVANDFKYYVISTAVPVVENNGILSDGILDPKKAARCVKDLWSFMEKLDVNYRINTTLPACLLKELPLEEMRRARKLTFRCSVPTGSTLYMGTQGEILSCNHLFNYPVGKLGVEFNNTEEFIAFWNEGAAGEYRRATQRYPSDKCIDCRFWKMCGGGCIIRCMAYSPDEYIVGLE